MNCRNCHLDPAGTRGPEEPAKAKQSVALQISRGLRIGLLYLVLIACPSLLAAEQLKVVFATGEWPPYSSEHLPQYGGAVALVSAVCRAAGIEPIFRFYPWKRAELQVLKGEVFAAFPYAISGERKVDFDFSDTLFHGLNVLVYHQGNQRLANGFNYAKPDDLQGYRIGGISGSFLKNELKQAGVEYQATTSIDQSVQKLAAGRIDFCIDDKVVLVDAIRRLYPEDMDKFTFVAATFAERKPTAMLVSRSYPDAAEILERLNVALRVIRESGEYDQIIDAFGMIK